MRRPNVLFLMSDQHNAKCLGCYGHPQVATPNLDALAAGGVRFESAFVQNPICTPSRMCYLSGQYCHNHGYYGLKGPTPPRLPSLFSHFREQGYRTGAVGKIHLPDEWIEPHCDLHAEAMAHFMDDPPGYREWLAERTDQPMHNEQSVDGRPDWLPKELDYDSGWAVERTREFLAAGGDQPFLLWLTFYKPHQEYSPAEEFWNLYDDPWLPPSCDDDGGGKLHPTRRMLAGYHANPPHRYGTGTYHDLRRRKQRGYLGNISQVDWAVGQVLAMLDELGLRDDTIVVYTSDHGDYACEHGLLEKAPGIAADAICRVPWIWSWPGHLPEGETRRQLVESIDLAPTLADLCGLPALEMWDGHALTEILKEDGAEVREAAFTENPWTKAVATDRYRLTWTPSSMYPNDPVQGELYDRLDDPWERHNLYHDPGYAPVVRRLERILADWLVTSTRPVTAWPIPPHGSLPGGRDLHNRGGAPYPEDGKTSPASLSRARNGNRETYL